MQTGFIRDVLEHLEIDYGVSRQAAWKLLDAYFDAMGDTDDPSEAAVRIVMKVEGVA